VVSDKETLSRFLRWATETEQVTIKSFENLHEDEYYGKIAEKFLEEKPITFGEALKKLNIEDYAEKIFNSNQYGELFFTADYIDIAEAIEGSDASAFRPWFESVIKLAESKRVQPEYVFMNIGRIFLEATSGKKPVDKKVNTG
jgi:hypothetical protein